MCKRGEGGWFAIPGVQDGERTIEEGSRGLGPLACEAKGATVLDLGCAEGLIGQWFIEHGATQISGLDASQLALRTGRRLFRDLPMTFGWADFNEPSTWPCTVPQFDIVLCLSVLHKLREPQPLLEYATLKARKWLAIRAPTEIVNGIAVNDMVLKRGFKLASQSGQKPFVWIFRGF